EDNEGIFSGFNAESGSYEIDKAHWNYEGEPTPPAGATPPEAKAEAWSQTLAAVAKGPPDRDPTLQHPNCVLNIMRRHYARYTPEMVADTCGCTKEQFLNVAELMMA